MSRQSDPQLGARPSLHMPAEWHTHDATWLSWPHNRDTWPGVFPAVEPAFCEIVAALSPRETVHINVLDEEHRRHVERLLKGCGPSAAIRTHVVPTNDAWIRDHGAIFVQEESQTASLVGLDFRFNAWGEKYPPFDLDDAVAGRMAALIHAAPLRSAVVLEGGSIDVDGSGLLLTTTSCLLNPNRNPDLDQAEIETILRSSFGARQILWLGDGIVGDDTDGHIDDISRFFAPASVVTAVEPDTNDPNHTPLTDNLHFLREARLDDGRSLEVVELPMPPAQFNDGYRLPASYANFYVANGLVLMPSFDCPSDEAARSVLGDLFPGRDVIAIDCRALVAGLGALHCLTQQVPASGAPAVA